MDTTVLTNKNYVIAKVKMLRSQKISNQGHVDTFYPIPFIYFSFILQAKDIDNTYFIGYGIRQRLLFLFYFLLGRLDNHND